MDQRGEQFVPHLLAITVGHHRRLPEQRHDVSQRLLARRAATRSTSAGIRRAATAAVKFDRPGIVPVFCDIHSHMSAYILVFNHPFFAVTDDDGRYSIPGVPPGTYTLVVWSELGHAETRRSRSARARPSKPISASSR